MQAKKLELVNNNQNNSEEGQSFVVDNDDKATWALRKIRQLKGEKSEHEKLASSQIEKLEAEIIEVKDWLEDVNSTLDDSIEFFEMKLKYYALTLKEENPDLKTHKLPFGKLQFRKSRDKWVYDNDKLLEFAERSFKDAVKVKKKVDKRLLKKKAKVVDNKAVIKDTGEVIGGIEIQKGKEKFRIKINK